jgi:hypothetical protein
VRGLASVEAKESEKFPLRRWGQRGHLFRIGPRAMPPPPHLSTSPDKQAMLYCSAESWRCMRQQRWSGATSGPPLNESGMLWKGSTTDGNGVLLWGGGDWTPTGSFTRTVRGTGLYRQSQLDGRWASSINTASTVLFHCLSTVWCLGFKPERLQWIPVDFCRVET